LINETEQQNRNILMRTFEHRKHLNTSPLIGQYHLI